MPVARTGEFIAPKYDLKWSPPVVRPAQKTDLKPEFWHKVDKLWVLVEEFTVVWIENGYPNRATVKAGMVTDGCSTPFFSWSFGFLPTGTEMGSSLIHDPAYECHGDIDKSPWLTLWKWNEKLGGWVENKGVIWSKEQTDHYFYMFMLAGGTDLKIAFLYWKCVLWFGLPAWNHAYPFNTSSVSMAA